MSSSSAFAALTDRFDHPRAQPVASEVWIRRKELPGLGHALFLELVVDEGRHALYPCPEADPDRAAALIANTPPPLSGRTSEVGSLEVEAASRGLRVDHEPRALVISHPDWRELMRQPFIPEMADDVELPSLGYLQAVGWLEGAVMRLCAACGTYSPLRDFVLGAHPCGPFAPECSDHWQEIPGHASEENC